MCIAATARPQPGDIPIAYSHKELVEHCINASPQDSVWGEFSNRFDPWIKYFLIKAWRPFRHIRAINLFDLLEELIQEVYILLIKDKRKALRSFRGATDSSFLAYLSIICTNTLREHIRSQLAAKRTAHLISFDLLITDEQTKPYYFKLFYEPILFNAEATMVSELMKKELWQRIQPVLKECASSRDQKIFLLVVLEGYSCSELVGMYDFHLKPSSINSIVRRTTTRLIDVLSTPKTTKPN